MFEDHIAKWTAVALDRGLAILPDHSGRSAKFLQGSDTALQLIRARVDGDVCGHPTACLTQILGDRLSAKPQLQHR